MEEQEDMLSFERMRFVKEKHSQLLESQRELKYKAKVKARLL